MPNPKGDPNSKQIRLGKHVIKQLAEGPFPVKFDGIMEALDIPNKRTVAVLLNRYYQHVFIYSEEDGAIMSFGKDYDSQELKIHVTILEGSTSKRERS